MFKGDLNEDRREAKHIGVIIHIEMPGKCCPPVVGRFLQSWVKALLHMGQQRGGCGHLYSLSDNSFTSHSPCVKKETGLLKIRESPLEVQVLILPKGFMLHVHTPAGIGIICAIQTKWPEHWMPFLP